MWQLCWEPGDLPVPPCTLVPLSRQAPDPPPQPTAALQDPGGSGDPCLLQGTRWRWRRIQGDLLWDPA